MIAKTNMSLIKLVPLDPQVCRNRLNQYWGVPITCKTHETKYTICIIYNFTQCTFSWPLKLHQTILNLQNADMFVFFIHQSKAKAWALSRGHSIGSILIRKSGCRGHTGSVIPICNISAIAYSPLHPPGLTCTQSVHGADGLGKTWSAPHVKTPVPHVMRRPGQSLFQRSTQVYPW